MDKKILIIDFDEESLNSTARLLENEGFKVITAGDGQTGLKKFESENPDLVVMEAMLPKLHGFNLCSKITHDYPDKKVPVIILTGVYREEKYKRESLRTYGASAFFEKPFEKEELLSTIFNLLGIIKEKRESEEEEELPEPNTVIETISSKESEKTKKELKEKKMKDEDIEKKLQETLSSLEIDVLKKDKKKPEIDREIETKLETTLAELGLKTKEEKPEIKPEKKPKAEAKKEEPNRLGEYVLVEKIGSGGMGEVFKATRKGVEGFEKTFAIKRIHQHLVEENEKVITMFIDEAKIAAQLSHPNIVHIYDLGKINNYYYIAMEYILGKDLEVILNRLRKNKKLMPYEYSALIGIKICQALDYAHRKHDSAGKSLGIVHRDVSPKNILISYEGEVKLTDFGVAKASSKIHKTIPGGIKGKIPYMSPEQAKGEEIDHRSDIYSLGSVLYEMCTGEKAFSGDNDIAILDKVRKGEFQPPSEINREIPKELENIILKALKYKPEDRYPNVNELRNELEKFVLSYKGEFPSSVDIARFMSELFAEEIRKKGIIIEALKEPRAPSVKIEEKRITPPSIPEEKEEVKPPVEKAPFSEYEEEKKKSPLPLVIGIVCILLIAAGSLYFFKFKKTTPKAQDKISMAVVPPKTEPPQEVAQEEPKTEEPTPLEQRPPTEPEKEVVQTPTSPQPKPKPTPRRTTTTVRQTPATSRTTPRSQPEITPPSPPPEETQPSETQTKSETKEETPKEETKTPETQVTEQKTQPVTPSIPKTKTGELIPLSQVDIKPVVVKRVEPEYPPLAQRMGVEGTVIVNALISENGDVIRTAIIRGIKGPYGLNEAAEKAVKQWKFKPAVKDGVRVKVWKAIPIGFKKK